MTEIKDFFDEDLNDTLVASIRNNPTELGFKHLANAHSLLQRLVNVGMRSIRSGRRVGRSSRALTASNVILKWSSALLPQISQAGLTTGLSGFP